MIRPFWLLILGFGFSLLTSPLQAESPSNPTPGAAPTSPTAPRNVTITARRTRTPIIIDGQLDEAVWQTEGYHQLIQSAPVDGGQPTEETRVWVAYDPDYLYVAARLYDREPNRIEAQLARRDDLSKADWSSDWFKFAIDPYFDQRTGFIFQVTPAGAISDARLYNDGWRDYSWDGLWDYATRIDAQGWTVELKIPFHQLHFVHKAGAEYLWGVDFQRTIRRKNELDGLIWVPKDKTGYVSYFARLEGIRDISTQRHLEIVPYLVGKLTRKSGESGDPFAEDAALSGSAGVDAKVGLGPNLTLTLSANPDFGQVELDPAEINLSAFETYYEEKRPFFVEGAETFNFGTGGAQGYWNFNWMDPLLFYSRRIGKSPGGSVSENYDYLDMPEETMIIGAAKLSGKIGQSWSIGAMTALTAAETAEYASLATEPTENGIAGTDSALKQLGAGPPRRAFSSGAISLNTTRLPPPIPSLSQTQSQANLTFGQQEVEPLSSYSVFRLQRDFQQGREGLGLMATATLRDLEPDQPLYDQMVEQAYSGGIDGWSFLDHDRTYVLTGWLAASSLFGSSASITRRQKSSLHYYQRPDASYVEVDDTATSLSGWATRFAINKEKGNIIFNSAMGAISPGFDVTDMGFQWYGDYINGHIASGYQMLTPLGPFRTWNAWLAMHRTYDFGGNRTSEGYFLGGGWEFLNYWGGDFLIDYGPTASSHTFTRGGPLAETPSYLYYRLNLYSDLKKPFQTLLSSELTDEASGSLAWSLTLTLTTKIHKSFSLSLLPEYARSEDMAQWVGNFEDPAMTATAGSHYLYGRFRQQTVAASLRLDWTMKPRMSLQFYLQPYIAAGDYSHFKELAAPGTYDFYEYPASAVSFDGTDYTIQPGPGNASIRFGNPDFTSRSLRGTAVYRWEYLPGSAVYLVWTQNRSESNSTGHVNLSEDIPGLISAPGENIFLVKVSYNWN